MFAKASLSALVLAIAFAASPSAHAEDALAASHGLAKQGGRLCMVDHAHSGFGTGASKPAARAAAVKSWIDFTNLEYGRSWASYSASGSQKVTYTKEASGWGATVEGRPCKR